MIKFSKIFEVFNNTLLISNKNLNMLKNFTIVKLIHLCIENNHLNRLYKLLVTKMPIIVNIEFS